MNTNPNPEEVEEICEALQDIIQQWCMRDGFPEVCGALLLVTANFLFMTAELAKGDVLLVHKYYEKQLSLIVEKMRVSGWDGEKNELD